MRKIFSFMLIAVGLLISGNVGAVNQQNGHATQQEGDVAEMKVTNTEMGTETVTYYATLQDAFDDLPTNSYPATITVLKNIEAPVVLSATQAWTVPANCNLTLDLNGKSVYTSTNNDNKSSALIKNNGTLTIKDGVGGGYLTNTSTTPDVEWQDRENYKYPAYANNVILNSGTVIVESGTIENGTDGTVGATHCIENVYGENSTVIINGGKLISHSTAVRFYGGKVSNFTMNGGVIEGDRMGFRIQSPQGTTTANFNDGVIISHVYGAIDIWSGSATNASKVKEVNFNGGTFYADGSLAGENEEPAALYIDDNASSINFNITGGVFNWASGNRFLVDDSKSLPENNTISGGVFETAMITSEAGQKLIKPGYGSRPLTDAEKASVVVRDENGNKIENFDFSNFQIVVPLETKTTTQEGDWNEAFGGSVPEEMDIVVVEHNITVSEGTNANAYTVKTSDQEAQIVVKNGAVLNVGNGGIVSENDDLVFVKVEAGGKLIVGNNGVDQRGNMYPIIIENNSEKSGVYMVSPNTSGDVAHPYIKATFATKAYKKGDHYYTQFLASPISHGKLYPTTNTTVLTAIAQWDYQGGEQHTGGWSYIQPTEWKNVERNWDMNKCYYIQNDAVEPGVEYTFEGTSAGNQDATLIFPEHGYCYFGNNYTAPVDIMTMFEQIANDMDQTGESVDKTVEYTVYLYDAAESRYINENVMSMVTGGAKFTQIPPMQGFLMNLQRGNSAGTKIDYRNAVWGNENGGTTPMRAPKKMENAFDAFAKIQVSANNMTDRIFIAEGAQFSDDFDNGYDATKYMTSNNFNLYVMDDDANYSMLATDNIEGTIIAFQAGEEVSYTLTLSNIKGNYMLKDLVTNATIDMTEGKEYTFAAQPKSKMPRFQIVSRQSTPTSIGDVKVKTAKGIYTLLGHYVGETSMWSRLSAGIYIVDGQKIAK